jgi:phosphonatase-like hydrolase
MANIKLAVFDMAGTTVNENNVVYKTLQKSINQSRNNISLDFVLEHGAGKEKLQAIIDILKKLDGSSANEVNDEAKAIFSNFKPMLKSAYINLDVEAYEGVEDLLLRLRNNNINVALNTGYDRNTAELLLNKMNWEKGIQFDVLITADDVSKSRPNPDMIQEAMRQLNITDPMTVLKAGDSIIDIEEGKNTPCGITIGVTTGAHTKDQLSLADPDYIVDRLDDIENLLNDHNAILS